MMKRLSLILITLCCLLVSTAATAADKKDISIGSWGTVDASYFLAGAISNILNEKLPYVNCIVVPSSSMKNTIGMEKGTIPIGWTQSEVLHFGPIKKAGGPFKKGEIFNKSRVLLYLGPSPMHAVVKADSKIKKITDINKNTKIGCFSPSSLGSVQTPLRYNGVKDGNYKLQFLNKNAQAEALKDGNLDVSFQSGNFPHPVVQKLAKEIDIRLLPWDPKKIKKAVSENTNYVQARIPKDSYGKGIPPQDITTMGTLITLGVSAHLDDKTVYDILKTIIENNDKIKAVHPDGRLFTIENTQYWIDQLIEQFPFHPGAKKYLAEKGVKFKN